MQREIITTSDGSKTLLINGLNEHYHSHNGAYTEALHVFIDNGLKKINNCEVNILELGFGTGLNVLVTVDYFKNQEQIKQINYFTVEKYPITPEEVQQLAYCENLKLPELNDIYHEMHAAPWAKDVSLLSGFVLHKINADFLQLDQIEMPEIDLVYFDCFGARVQPDLWERPLVEKVAAKMHNGALLTTYSSKGSFRRILQDVGFEVTKLAGPRGKREMINAILNTKK
ncbi:MAG: peptidase [Chryseobacterium sp.]|nr:MAG: peptidase [Chryseobacterium sp.]